MTENFLQTGVLKPMLLKKRRKHINGLMNKTIKYMKQTVEEAAQAFANKSLTANATGGLEHPNGEKKLILKTNQ